jgi:AAA domain
MLKVTFYSYKGGVGRTLAMLNVAALLAERGRRVLVVDFDLEAPGLGLSALTSIHAGAAESTRAGVSDFLLDRAASLMTPISTYIYSAMTDRFENRFQVLTAGTRAGELSGKIEELFREPQGDLAHLFILLVTEIEAFIDPDYVFFDSRTGLADVAGVCTMELPEVLVAVCGLNEQNIGGMEGALARMREYWRAVSRDVATLLVLSPVPQEIDLQLHPLAARIYEAQVRLLAPLKQDLPRIQPQFPNLQETDLLHLLEYEPRLALQDALVTEPHSALARQYENLTQSIVHATAADGLVFPGRSYLEP